jgi:hypothetical protein
VEEGLFLLNKSMEIGTQYSSVLEKIFETDNLAGKNFVQLLKDKTEPEILSSTQQFLNLLFSVADPALINDLNPLDDIQLKFARSSKFLSFKFGCIKNNENETEELIVTVNDITKETILARSL